MASYPAPVRGVSRGDPSLAWRLDGAAGDPRAPLVLCLHGMGMDEDSFALLLSPLFDLPARFLVPRGAVALAPGEGPQAGAAHPAGWYRYDGDQGRFRQELARTEATLLALLADVEAARSLAPRARAVLGFSMGGYQGSFVAVRHPEVFDAVVVSGARVKTEFLEDEIRAAGARGFGALLLHGDRDRAVSPGAALRSRDGLLAGGVAVDLVTFDAGHSFGRRQAAAVREWLQARWRLGAPPC